MRVLIQRVKEARVTVEGEVVGEINGGLLLFLGIHKDDDEGKIPWLAEKVVNLRIFEDDAGKMNRSVKDVEGKILIVSQFTLYGDCETGRRPSFTESMPSLHSEVLYRNYVKKVQELIGVSRVQTGSFGSHMEIHLLNDGPVTFLLSR